MEIKYSVQGVLLHIMSTPMQALMHTQDVLTAVHVENTVRS